MSVNEGYLFLLFLVPMLWGLLLWVTSTPLLQSRSGGADTIHV
jgi:hypothetical protein